MQTIRKRKVQHPKNVQLIKVIDQVEEERHAIMFLHKVDRQKYG